MKKHIVCFGDSNTHGYCADPNDSADRTDRFNEDERWTCLLQKALGEEYLVLEEGLSGRTTVFSDPLHECMSGLDVIYSTLMSHAVSYTHLDVYKRQHGIQHKGDEEEQTRQQKQVSRCCFPPHERAAHAVFGFEHRVAPPYGFGSYQHTLSAQGHREGARGGPKEKRRYEKALLA